MRFAQQTFKTDAFHSNDIPGSARGSLLQVSNCKQGCKEVCKVDRPCLQYIQYPYEKTDKTVPPHLLRGKQSCRVIEMYT